MRSQTARPPVWPRLSRRRLEAGPAPPSADLPSARTRGRFRNTSKALAQRPPILASDALHAVLGKVRFRGEVVANRTRMLFHPLQLPSHLIGLRGVHPGQT